MFGVQTSMRGEKDREVLLNNQKVKVAPEKYLVK